MSKRGRFKPHDLTGQRFGRLIALHIKDGEKKAYGGWKIWSCRCDCGKEISVSSKDLKSKSGGTKSCVCLRSESVSEYNLIDLSGLKFDRWSVIHRADDCIARGGSRRVRWVCVCECGSEKLVSSAALLNRKSRSCGCFKKEVDVETAKRNFTKYPNLSRKEVPKLWRKNNPEKVRASRHRRRAREADCISTLTADEWASCLNKHNYRCAYCGVNEADVGKLTIDHVIPISRGGDNIIENVVPACSRCNSSKGFKTPEEFALFKLNKDNKID